MFVVNACLYKNIIFCIQTHFRKTYRTLKGIKEVILPTHSNLFVIASLFIPNGNLFFGRKCAMHTTIFFKCIYIDNKKEASFKKVSNKSGTISYNSNFTVENCKFVLHLMIIDFQETSILRFTYWVIWICWWTLKLKIIFSVIDNVHTRTRRNVQFVLVILVSHDDTQYYFMVCIHHMKFYVLRYPRVSKYKYFV